ncbi:MAG: fumarate hydratase [Clostridia bacterium]
MKEIDCKQITETIKRLCIKANYYLPEDVKQAICKCQKEEPYPLAKNILENIKINFETSEQGMFPICQDTGMTCVFIEIGQEVHIINGNLEDAINEGVRQGYEEGYLRKSIVDDALFERINTKNNTPAIINYEIVPGDKLKITVAPKGFGSENMSRIKMLKPSDGVEGVKKFVIETVEQAGANACPPMVIGVGIGGNFEKVALLAKKAMLREIGTKNKDERYAKIEEELLEEINKLGIGPAGYGGKTTALSLNIENYPTHIAGMPVAVSICCHVARHKEAVL